MVKKSKNDSNLIINTAVRKSESKKHTVVNLSRTISIPVTYSVEGNQTSFMLPPSSRQVLPEEAEVVTQDKNIKVV